MKRLANEAEVQTANGLRKLVLLSWTDSNMYESWTWEIFLTERFDGSISTGARQFGEGIPPGRMLGTYRIRTGAALRDAVESLFASDVFQDVDWNWSSLLPKIAKFKPKLAKEITRQFQLESDEESLNTEEFERGESLMLPVREWVNRSKWPHSTGSGAGGIVSAVANARLRSGVTAYAQAYRDEHGHFPTGMHEIDQPIGDAASAARCAEQGNGIGRAFSAPGRVQLTVQFPELRNDGDFETLQKRGNAPWT